MATDEPEVAGTEFVALSETYTDRVHDCVDALDAVVERWAEGRSYGEPLRRVREFETVCDVTEREVTRTLVGFRADGTTPFGRSSVNLDDVAELYHALDDVANAAERTAEELAAIDPTLPRECAEGIRTMASLAVDAMALLETAIDGYVRALREPGSHARIRDAVEQIRGLESQCDELRNHVVDRAFAEVPDATALTCRHLATGLDAVVDAIEDVTDRLVYASGGQPWIDVPLDHG
ncbi:MAG: DUF47 domain-containing protein [Haloferacaceae archaeon]